MIASTLTTREITVKGSSIQEITWVYNNLRHATTRQTPYNIMFARPILEIMDETRITGILASIFDTENIVVQDENESEDPEDTLNINNFDSNFLENMDLIYTNNRENL
ncbi:hypothetical protein DMUE_3435, partial [Dictyocoela muelleri]